MPMNPYTNKAIEDKYGLGLPAGLNNLAPSTRLAIKSDHKRMLDNIRQKMRNDQPITEEDLKRE